jgi:hypothetical protein
MSNKRISQLDPVLVPNNSDVFAIVNSGETKKISYGSLKGAIAPNGTRGTGLGWARYDDSQYTSSSKFTINSGQTVTLPNNANTKYETYLNSSTSFYTDGVTPKIRVENLGDVYTMTVVFRCSAANANQTYGHISLDSTSGTPYERVAKDFYFPKGNNIVHNFHEVFQYYADADFLANGNKWTVTATGGALQIWDIIYFIQRTQNHA